MEKRLPHYDLDSIKAAFPTPESLVISATAQRCVDELGFKRQDVVNVIQALGRSSFYKSMTSYANSAVWQDVYHPVYQGIELYVKFTTDDQGYWVISFKER